MFGLVDLSCWTDLPDQPDDTLFSLVMRQRVKKMKTNNTCALRILEAQSQWKSHLGDGYFCTFVDKLNHIVGLSLVWSYEEALGKCEDLSCILLAHEAGRVIRLSLNIEFQMLRNVEKVKLLGNLVNTQGYSMAWWGGCQCHWIPVARSRPLGQDGTPSYTYSLGNTDKENKYTKISVCSAHISFDRKTEGADTFAIQLVKPICSPSGIMWDRPKNHKE